MRIQLTKKIVTATLPRDRPYDVRDALVRGLLLRVQPSGHRAWIVTWAHGKRRTLGSVEHLSLDHAREVARKVIAEYIQTGLPSIAKPELPKITLRAYLDEHYAPWIKTELKQADDALRRIEQAFTDLLPMTLKDINAKVIERWWVARLKDTIRPGEKQTISKATASRNLATLRSALSRAVKWGLLESNPVTDAALKVAKPRSVVRFLSPAEEHRLRSALTARDHAHAAARRSANQWRAARKRALLPEATVGAYADHLPPVVLLAMNTGLRKGELLSLDWSDINIQARTLTVRAESAKSGKQRHVPLNGEAITVLRQWATQSSGVGSVFCISGMKSSWEKLLVDAKITGFRFHDLRHHFASKLVMAGVDLNTVRELLGHADITMTLRYAHLGPEHLAAAVEKLAA